MKRISIFFMAPLLLTGCLPEDGNPDVDQSEICIASSDEQALECPEGELFLARFVDMDNAISAYRTLNTAALYCDTNHAIFKTDAGVLCVLTHQRFDLLVASNDMSPVSPGAMESDESEDRHEELGE
ncbi:hypothetical protein [Halomonas salipaludis]|uniref:Lipoprotein n=1 Tax=Halomonas salipaludis TaxID=2032625 RepID=A0A2A2EW53_9GAMM|nr:hypothetical protein [Halomonas salipaludis]PAU76635.1 hypothetical protein CK498_11625 [Halomonas salipaludis]